MAFMGVVLSLSLSALSALTSPQHVTSSASQSKNDRDAGIPMFLIFCEHRVNIPMTQATTPHFLFVCLRRGIRETCRRSVPNDPAATSNETNPASTHSLEGQSALKGAPAVCHREWPPLFCLCNSSSKIFRILHRGEKKSYLPPPPDGQLSKDCKGLWVVKATA